MELEVKNCDEPKIERIFRETATRFPDLDVRKLTLDVRYMTKRTMQAQPVVNFRFFSTRSREYKIEMSPRIPITKIDAIEKLPEKVLEGWFAHEIGHIVDYQDKSVFQLIFLGIMYMVSKRFKMGVEKAADVFAIANGYGPSIVATKQFIIEHSEVEGKYLRNINRYYMTIDEVEELMVTHSE